jgi:glucosamine--fructose-6-phosphate aminotransferase (isomerizing)
MCGIVGYTGREDGVPVLIESLKKLEYRGYDSAGIAVFDEENRLRVVKKEGRIAALEKNLGGISGCCGIGHTRWATHGKPSDANSHPHRSGKFVLVHNGIIENFLELKIELVNEGRVFASQTDSEVIAHLLSKNFEGDLLSALKKVTTLLRGSYALAVMCDDLPGVIAAAKKDNQLVIGVGQGRNYLASDVLALAQYTKRVKILNDGEFGLLTPDGVTVYDNDFKAIDRETEELNLEEGSLLLGENESFMLKEIREIPKALEDTFAHYMAGGFSAKLQKVLAETERVTFVACGTAYHAGICGKYVIEELCRLPVNVEIASEYRYKNPIAGKNELVVAISQSGETADTLAALKLAKANGLFTAAITNVATSSVTRLADFLLPMRAGAEIAVAATKSYNCQLAVLYMLGLELRRLRGGKGFEEYEKYIRELPELCRRIIGRAGSLNAAAGRLSGARNVFFLGRNLDYAVALEGSLKLKEISYIHSEGYPAGELKHGTLALIEKDSLVVTLITQPEIAEKTLNALHEVKARDAEVVLLTQLKDIIAKKEADLCIELPETHPLLMPVLCVIPLQIFAYYMARARGNDPDKPRNLAKSVTVE